MSNESTEPVADASVEFVDAKEKGDASPFPGPGFVAPANTPVAPMYASSGASAEAPKPDAVQKPIQVASEHQQTPSLESTDMSALIQQAVTGDVNVAQLTQQINTLQLAKDEGDEEEEEEEGEEDEEMEREAKILDPIQEELNKVEEQYAAERLALELKYQAIYKPIYEKRCAAVNGEAAPAEGAEAGEEKEEGISAFWLSVMTSIKAIGEFITEADEEALEHLRDVRLTLLDSSSGDQKLGYKLDFEFEENPFFTNKVLSKTLEVPKLFTLGDLQFGKMYGTEIEWKSPEKNLCLPPPGEEDAAPDSFFLFFDVKTADIPISSEGEENVELTEEQYFTIQRDYQIAEALRTKAVPEAIKWFTGENYEDEDEEGEEEGEEGEEEEEEDEDEEDDEEDDDDEGHGHSHHGHRHRHGHSHAHGGHQHSHGGNVPQFNFQGGAPKEGAQNAECKQQ